MSQGRVSFFVLRTMFMNTKVKMMVPVHSVSFIAQQAGTNKGVTIFLKDGNKFEAPEADIDDMKVHLRANDEKSIEL